MAKYVVTPELAETIRTVRTQNHVPAKEVAEKIGKSAAYISKLEKGDIKTIREKDLTQIFRSLFNNNDDFQDFIETTLEKLLDTLELKFSNDEIKKQVWLDNYDTVLRKIPIPEEMVDDINIRMDQLNYTVAQLCDRINSNEDIRPEVENTDKYPFNEWQAFVVDHEWKFSFIKMKVTVGQVEEVLTKKVKTSNYVLMLSIAYYLMREEIKSEIGKTDSDEVMRQAKNYLNSFKFYSKAEKAKLLRQAKTDAEIEGLLSSFDKANSDYMFEIVRAFNIFSEFDIEQANKSMEEFVKNLRWDSGFMMALVGCGFNETGSIVHTVKKDMLNEIRAIIEKYKKLPETEKRFEKYE